MKLNLGSGVRNRLASLLFAFCLAAFASRAGAESGAGPQPGETDTPGESSGDTRFSDANADRVVLYSTAETHPKGTVFFTDYELIFLQIGYAITDDFQIALTGVPPLVTDQPYFFDVSGKLNIYRSDRFRAAVIGSLDAIIAPNGSSNSLYGARLGGVGQICFEVTCRAGLSLNAGTILNNRSNEVVPVLLSGGLTFPLGSVAKLLLEPSYAVAIGNGKVDGPDGFLLAYGVRFSGQQWGFDINFVRPIGTDGALIMGHPLARAHVPRRRRAQAEGAAVVRARACKLQR